LPHLDAVASYLRLVDDVREPTSASSTVPADDEGGDRACWAGLLCPECGALPDATDARPRRCARCGAALPDPD
jgi:hypothetical protein